MLAQDDSPAESNHGLIKKTAFNTERVAVRQIRNQSFREQVNVGTLDAHRFRADLLVVTHDDDLLCKIQVRECVRPALARLFNNHNVE